MGRNCKGAWNLTVPPMPEMTPVFTPAEEGIIATAMSILPHLGADATVAYLERASETSDGAHEDNGTV